ncbi:putative nitrogen fixation protein NifT [Denitromonas iodatirespirans]|uniref:Nitrogen fixation protein NifT n=1 Tax=Denitromonas iodatirespirans TaxID=2795389 RepID=A0A944DD35_DENI1|nr:putative nitrogen fixation protein NifT [Denitromonas iodatirespirans]MBT0960513.1 putative nitrogen fixation protein NifT [Denitromonas iodatirespirans]
MANIMIRQAEHGGLSFYLPKRDLEASIESIEFDTPEKWGGELKLDNGGAYYIEPIARPPRLPISLRARRLGAAED